MSRKTKTGQRDEGKVAVNSPRRTHFSLQRSQLLLSDLWAH